MFDIIDITLKDIEIQPYVRMTQRGKYVKPEALRYITNQQELKLKLKSFLNACEPTETEYPIPDETSFCAAIYVFTGKRLNRCDVDNIVKAVLDGCQGVVFNDDRWCDAIIASRHETKEEPFIRICFTPWLGTWGE